MAKGEEGQSRLKPKAHHDYTIVDTIEQEWS